MGTKNKFQMCLIYFTNGMIGYVSWSGVRTEAVCGLKQCADWSNVPSEIVCVLCMHEIPFGCIMLTHRLKFPHQIHVIHDSQLFQITHRMMRTMFYVHNMMRMWFKLHAHILSGENLDEKWAIIKLFDELETKMHLYGVKSELQVPSAHQVMYNRGVSANALSPFACILIHARTQ